MHEGHRKRMLERLENEEKGLKDHELLEILLFNAIPRKNTNQIAHLLLDKFGSVSGLARASIPAIMTVEGVGENTAAYLRCFFLIMERMKLDPNADFPSAGNYASFTALLAGRMRGLNHECIELYATDRSGNILGVETYTSNEKGRAEMQPSDISKFFAKHSPKALIIAHNHLRDPCLPSERDDIFTRRMQAICAFHNIPLYDHLIVGPTEIYSYHVNNRFPYISTIPLESIFMC